VNEFNEPGKRDNPLPDEIPVTAEGLRSGLPWADMPDAKKEEEKWDTLDDVKLKNDKRWLTVYGWVFLTITVVFTFVFVVALLVWVFHYLIPEGWHWLEDQQLSKIQSVLFSGGMGAVISGIIRTQLGKT